MRINWDLKNPVNKKPSFFTKFKRLLAHKPVPLHCSNHYRRESFHDDGAPRLF